MRFAAVLLEWVGYGEAASGRGFAREHVGACQLDTHVVCTLLQMGVPPRVPWRGGSLTLHPLEGAEHQVETEDGMQFELEGKDTKELQPLDPKVLGTNISDLIKLDDLTEESLMHVLRTRYMSNIIYTSVGSILVSINPFKPLPLYTPDWLERYHARGAAGEPPHVYAVADTAYRALLGAWRDGLHVVYVGFMSSESAVFPPCW